jgi:ferredoxin
MKQKVRIDPALCEGHGRCYALCPDLFTDDESGYGVVRDGIDLSTPTVLASAQSAIAICPESAISIVTTDE